MKTIKFIPKAQLQIIIPFVKMLNDCSDNELSQSAYEERLEQMYNDHNYQCVGVYEGDKLIAVSGLWTLNKHYIGKHVEPDNVVVLPEYRGQGIGEELMQWIFEYAKSIGCVGSEVNCYVKNKKGVKFWESLGYKTIGYHMQMKFN